MDNLKHSPEATIVKDGQVQGQPSGQPKEQPEGRLVTNESGTEMPDGVVVGADGQVTQNGQPVDVKQLEQQQQVNQGNNEKPQETKETKEETQQDLLAGKYKNEQELDKGLENLLKSFGSKEDAYKALEKARGVDQLKGEQKEVTQDQAPETAQEEAEEIFGQKDLEKYYGEFLDNDGLTDESKKALKKKGIDPATAEAAIAGIKAQKDAYVNQVFEMAGGQEEYQNLTKWLQDNADPELLQTFQVGVVELGQKAPELSKLIIEGAKSLKNAASPELISGSMADGAADVYETREQFEADVAEYMRTGDSKKEAEVWQKFQRSKFNN